MKILDEIRRELVALRESVTAPLPAALSIKEAARQLSVSVSTLQRMVREGTLCLTKHRLRSRHLVPASEIRRLAAPAAPAPSATPRRSPKGRGQDRRTPGEMAEQVRAELRAERKAARAKSKKR